LVAVLPLWLRTQIGFEKWEILSLVLLFTSAYPATVEIGRLNLLADKNLVSGFLVCIICLFCSEMWVKNNH